MWSGKSFCPDWTYQTSGIGTVSNHYRWSHCIFYSDQSDPKGKTVGKTDDRGRTGAYCYYYNYVKVLKDELTNFIFIKEEMFMRVKILIV